MAFNHEVFRHAQLTDGEKSWHFPLIHKKNQNSTIQVFLTIVLIIHFVPQRLPISTRLRLSTLQTFKNSTFIKSYMHNYGYQISAKTAVAGGIGVPRIEALCILA